MPVLGEAGRRRDRRLPTPLSSLPRRGLRHRGARRAGTPSHACRSLVWGVAAQRGRGRQGGWGAQDRRRVMRPRCTENSFPCWGEVGLDRGARRRAPAREAAADKRCPSADKRCPHADKRCPRIPQRRGVVTGVATSVPSLTRRPPSWASWAASRPRRSGAAAVGGGPIEAESEPPPPGSVPGAPTPTRLPSILYFSRNPFPRNAF